MMMWRRLSAWYQAWNDELLAILLQPELSLYEQGSLNHKLAQQLAHLSMIERRQLHHFCIVYQGWRFWRVIAACTGFFCAIGVILSFWTTSLSMALAMLAANFCGFFLLAGLFGIWFNYRRIVAKKYRIYTFSLGYLFGAALIGSAVGAFLKNKPLLPALLERAPRIFVAVAVLSLVWGLLVALVAAWRNMGYERIATEMQWEAERERVARELSESQLRLLRAQIEPHFLFNTLGAVQQLAEQGTKDENGESKAAQLTANLIVFLRASMSEMRAEQITLEEEFAMVQAYLQVMQVRMAHRLRFSLELPPQFAQHRIPSMVLLTLAENAIKHGLEPSIRGGSIELSAQCSGDLLHVTVRDSGVGLSEKLSHGVGLQNVRDRLRLAYAGRAKLEVSESVDGGVIAEICLPFQGT